MARDLLSLGISVSSNGELVPGDALSTNASTSHELPGPGSDFHTFASRAVELARILTGATGSAIAFREEQGTICRARSGQGAPRIGARVDATAGISKQCLDSGTALYCADTATDIRINPEAARGLGIRSVAVVPVRSNGEDGEVCGILEVFSDRPDIFTDRHLKTLHHLAVLIGTASQPNGAKPAITTQSVFPEVSTASAPLPKTAATTVALPPIEPVTVQAPKVAQTEETPRRSAGITIPAATPAPPKIVPLEIAAEKVVTPESAKPDPAQTTLIESAPAKATSPAAWRDIAATKVVAKNAAPPNLEPQLELLPSSESARRVFLSNLAIVFAPEPARSRLRASVPQRWSYVPLDSHIPLSRFFQSIAVHVIVIAAVAGIAQIWPRSISFETRRHERITYYPFSAAAPPARPRNPSVRSAQQRAAAQKKINNTNPAAEAQLASAKDADNTTSESNTSHSASAGSPRDERASTPPPPSIDGVSSRNPQLPIAVAVLPPPPDVGAMNGRQLNHSSSAIVAPPPELGGNYGSRTLNHPASGIIPPSPEARSLASQAGRIGQLGNGIVPPPPAISDPSALTYVGAARARPGVQVIAPPPSIPGGARLGPGGSITLGAKASQIVPPPPSVQDGGSSSRDRRIGSLSGTGSSIVPPPPAIEVVGGRNGKGVGSIAGTGTHIVPPPPSVQVARNRNGTGLGSLAGSGSGIVPPPPTVHGGAGSRGGAGLGSLSGVGSGIVPPPPSIQGTGGRGGTGVGSLSGSGSGIVPPPPSIQGTGGRGGTGVGSLSGSGSGIVPPPPGMQGMGSRGGGVGSIAGTGTIVPPPPSLGNGSGGRGGANGLAGLGSQVVPPPVSLDGGGNSMGGSSRAASLAHPSVEVVAPRTDPRAATADIPSNPAPAAADNNLQPTFQNVQLRVIVSAWAPPRSSYFSSFEVFIAQKWLNKETPQLIKLVYEFLPYQRRLSEFTADSWKVRKLRVVRDPKCDESLMQIEWPEGPNGRPGLVQSDNAQLPEPADRDAPLPCYRTTADDYRRAVSSH